MVKCFRLRGSDTDSGIHGPQLRFPYFSGAEVVLKLHGDITYQLRVTYKNELGRIEVAHKRSYLNV